MPPNESPNLGIEDGAIYNINGTLHMFPTELTDGWTKNRVVHWTTPENDRTKWEFIGGITPYGHGECDIDDHHAEHWSGAPQWEPEENNWFLTVVGYNQNCNTTERSASGGDGRILLYKSTVPGYEDGIGGPYEIEIEGEGLIPRPTSVEAYNEQAWEDWGAQEGIPFDPDTPFPERIVENGICSLSPTYKSARPEDPEDRIWTIYGSAWYQGLAYSDSGIRGPWIRADSPEINPAPIGDWGNGGPENAQIVKSSSGVYLMFWAANLVQIEHGLAFAWSKDGVNWEDATGDGVCTGGKAGYMIEPAPRPHQALRTPLGLVEHADKEGFFTLFYSSLVSLHENSTDVVGGYANLYQTEFQLVLTMDN